MLADSFRFQKPTNAKPENVSCNLLIMEYTLSEHTHRFAVWTAARSVQRSWTTTSKISQVIQSTRLHEFVSHYANISEQTEFDEMHRNWCDKMIDEFRVLNVAASYGRVAKIIAIYFKTSIIIGADSGDKKIKFIHPPIDRILLRNLPTNVSEFKSIRRLNWTQLDKQNYWLMVETIRGRLGLFDRRLEMLWRPELEKE